MSPNDRKILNEAVRLEQLGVKVELDAGGDVWSRASTKHDRGVEWLGRVDDWHGFKAALAKRLDVERRIKSGELTTDICGT